MTPTSVRAWQRWQRGQIYWCTSALFPEPFDVTNHTTPKKLGSMIKNQGVKRVVLTHLYPQSGAPTIVGWDMMSVVI